MSFSRKVLYVYRNFLNFLYRRKTNGIIFPEHKLCRIIPNENGNINLFNGDVVHPCVRFVSKGFKGHKWWMIYTPYYKSDPAVENPILCWGEGDEDDFPTEWHVETIVQDKYDVGYNSDPYLMFYEDRLLCYWRENYTPSLIAENLCHGTYMKSYGSDSNWSEKKLIIAEQFNNEDRETSPAFTVEDGQYIGFGMWLKFKNSGLRNKLSNKFKIIYDRIINILDIIGIFSQQHFNGVVVWKGSSIDSKHTIHEVVPIRNTNKLYRPWHMDIFEYMKKKYMIIQTNQSNADICLAEQIEDGSFRMFPNPIITGKDINMVGIYKPTAGVVNGKFYLYYTAQNPRNRSFNKLFLATMTFSDLISKVNYQ